MRKDIIITALLTFCLTATLFMMATTYSQTEPAYDPWADYNADGTIDIFDIVPVALTFGSAGDSTKNVTIAGHANKLAFAVSTGLDGDSAYDTDWISIDGYSKVAVCVGSDATQYQFRITTKSYSAGKGYTVYVETGLGTDYCDFTRTFDVPNEQIRVGFYNIHPTSRDLWIDVYLIP